MRERIEKSLGAVGLGLNCMHFNGCTITML